MASFARLYDTINEKEWFLRLKPEERCVYLQLLAYSTKDRGCLHTSNCWVLSQKLMIEEPLLLNTIELLISIGRLERAGDKLMLSDYSEYNPDPTNAKRQSEFKLRNHEKQKQVTRVTVGNASNASNDNNAPEPEPEPEPEPLNTPKGVLVTASPEFADVLLKWNLLCAEINSIPKITAITGKRRTAIKARLSDKAFDFDKLIEAIREQPFLHGQNDRNWIVKFDWAIAETNWPKIIERNYANSRPSAPRKQNTTKQLDPEFAKQLAEREQRPIIL